MAMIARLAVYDCAPLQLYAPIIKERDYQRRCFLPLRRIGRRH
jgi:hypothetical protein